MKFKKAFGRIYDVELNAKEQEILDRKVNEEIRRIMPEYISDAAKEMDAMILWYLHENESTRFGHKRLRSFFDDFHVKLDELTKWYQMGSSDKSWLCSYKLKQYGIDISKWQEELGEKREAEECRDESVY